jgi:hypothetical protein
MQMQEGAMPGQAGAVGGAPPPAAAVPVELVLSTLRAAMSHAQDERVPAEALLRSWEADAAPGFLHSLMLIVQQQQAIDEVRGRRGWADVDSRGAMLERQRHSASAAAAGGQPVGVWRLALVAARGGRGGTDTTPAGSRVATRSFAALLAGLALADGWLCTPEHERPASQPGWGQPATRHTVLSGQARVRSLTPPL